eukprot:527955_1
MNTIVTWILIIYAQISKSIGRNVIYVDSLGIDSDECGHKLNPCGTIGFATAISMYHTQYMNDTTANIFVTGQNNQEINEWKHNNKQQGISFIDKLQSNQYYFNHRSPCLTYALMDKSYTITFDPNRIKSMKDWFPGNCVNFNDVTVLFIRIVEDTKNDRKQVITFNNLIINNITISSESDKIRGFISAGFNQDLLTHVILNNCSFFNIKKHTSDGASTVDILQTVSGNGKKQPIRIVYAYCIVIGQPAEVSFGSYISM